MAKGDSAVSKQGENARKLTASPQKEAVSYGIEQKEGNAVPKQWEMIRKLTASPQKEAMSYGIGQKEGNAVSKRLKTCVLLAQISKICGDVREAAFSSSRLEKALSCDYNYSVYLCAENGV